MSVGGGVGGIHHGDGASVATAAGVGRAGGGQSRSGEELLRNLLSDFFVFVLFCCMLRAEEIKNEIK